jgi:hypothetical protein
MSNDSILDLVREWATDPYGADPANPIHGGRGSFPDWLAFVRMLLTRLDNAEEQLAQVRADLAACQRDRSKAVEALDEAVQSIKAWMRTQLADRAIEESGELKRYVAIIAAQPALVVGDQ